MAEPLSDHPGARCEPLQVCLDSSAGYSHHLNTSFRMSADQCRAAQSNWGWSLGQERIHLKLKQGQQVNVVAIGGSNTCGMNYCNSPGRSVDHRCDSPDAMCDGRRVHMGKCGNLTAAWPALLHATLGKCFKNVSVVNRCMRAVGSEHWSSYLSSSAGSHLLDNADAVILEVATNDAARSTQDPFGLQALTAQERLTQILLTHRRRPFILFLNAGAGDYTARPLLGSPGSLNLSNPPLSKDTRVHEMHNLVAPMDSDEALSRLARHYGLPYTSLKPALAPFSGVPFEELDRFWMDGFFFGDNIHASRLGHRMIAAAVVHRLLHVLEEDTDSSSSLWFQGQTRFYAAPTFLTAGAMKLAGLRQHRFDFRSPTPAVVDASGFGLNEDVEGKPGLLGHTAGAYVLVAIPAATRRIDLGAMHSYEHNGRMRAIVYSLNLWTLEGIAACLCRHMQCVPL